MRKYVNVRKQISLSEVREIKNTLEQNVNDLTPEGKLALELVNTCIYWNKFSTNMNSQVKVRNKYLKQLGYKIQKGRTPLKKID